MQQLELALTQSRKRALLGLDGSAWCTHAI